jgi:cytochrome c oxidase cbb3-type subunit 3
MKNVIKYTIVAVTIVVLGYTNTVIAQDGESLFKAKCNACHIMGKDGTGPNLQGVKAKWEGEEDFLYEWVVNSPKVIAEGISQRAQEVKDWSPTAMPPQDVTLEEAAIIIDYVDAWTAPVVEDDGDDIGEAIVVSVPDYKKNLTLFYVLVIVIFFLLIAIMVVSKSTSSIIKSDLFKQKLVQQGKNGNNSLKMIGLLIASFGVSQTANALSFEAPSNIDQSNLWLYVENSDLYVLLIIALLLLGFLMHTVNMFYGMLRLIKPKKEKTAEEVEASSLSRILTGAVPIEEEHKIDLGHDYDGIRELDNPMPPWWLAGFFISIVFAVVYMFHYHVLGTGDLQHVEYEKSIEQAEKEIQAYRDKMAMNIDETNATMMTDASDLQKGKELFINNCATCHQENGSGGVGPNLTDAHWIYGGDIKDIYKVIRKGAPNGMPEHQSKFNPIQIQQVSSYVLTLDLVSPEQGGKEPEGEVYKSNLDEETDTEIEEIETEVEQEVDKANEDVAAK